MDGADPRWREIWQEKGAQPASLAGGEGDVMATLLRLGGYDSATATTSSRAFDGQVAYIAALLGLRRNESLFEVGCGAGATLRALRPHVASVAGLDYAASLAAIARIALAPAEIACAEADALEVEPRFDAVLSVGAFLYFPDEAYLIRVLERMVAKARRAVAVIDLNDAACRETALRLRREAAGGRPGPDQLFVERGLFREFAAAHGLRLRIDDCRVADSINRHYRFNVLLEKPDPARAG